ncbi:DUF308 domain-containing protein [Virgibacillus necropolis]|uniref:YqeB family protein n=1 Tax=Virgibacillus necropolis TaxID=163877 RepID=UPI00384AEFFB
MTAQKSSYQEKTIVGITTKIGIGLYILFGALGLILGYFLPRIAAWALTLPWVPFQGPIELINSFSGPLLDVIMSLIGLIAGFAIAYISIRESLIVTVTDQETQLDKDGNKQTIVLKSIDTVFSEDKQLVFLDTSGREIAREKTDENAEHYSNAFKKHGYPWSAEGDPYKDQYRRWVLDTPDLSPAVNALMKAREKALKKKEKDEIKDLRSELAKLDIVVRDEGERQYWRQILKT